MPRGDVGEGAHEAPEGRSVREVQLDELGAIVFVSLHELGSGRTRGMLPTLAVPAWTVGSA